MWLQLENEFKQSGSDSSFLHNVIKQRSILVGIKNNYKFIHEYSNYCKYPITLVELSPYEHYGRVLLVNKKFMEADECLVDCGMVTHCVLISHDLKKQIAVQLNYSRPMTANSRLVFRQAELIINPVELMI